MRSIGDERHSERPPAMTICAKLDCRPIPSLRTGILLCLSVGMTLAGCGGGGGGGGGGASSATAQGCTPSVTSSYAPVATSGYVDGSGDGSGAGGSSGRGGSSGAGAGGGLGVYVNALITVQRADGTVVGSAQTDSYGMVTVSNCGNTQPLLFTVQGTQTGTYWDESLRTPVAFGASQMLHAVVVPDAPNQQTLYRNVGITPLTEAVYQYLNASGGAFGWTVVANVTAANAAIASQINQVLPPNLQLHGTDITRLAAVARDSTSQVFSGSTPNLTYGLVIGGMAQAAGLHNTQSTNPGLDLLGQLAADLSDGNLDGAKNGTPVAPSPTQAAYNLPTMTADTLGGIAALVATNGAAVPPATYTSYRLGGSISGLTASGLVLADGTSTVAVPSGATSFTFGGVVTSSAPYAISVQAQPSGLTCSLLNASGNAGTADVGNVAVTCSGQSYTVGGTISGLTANGLVLANGSDTLNVPSGATSFTMPRAVASGGGYAVTVSSQPSGENCTVTNGSGTVTTSNVANVGVSCSASSNYTLSGTISGLTSGGLVLANNGSATVGPFSANTISFSFGAVLTPGSSYAVTVQTTPTGLTCSVANGSGTAGAADVSDVKVTCSNLSYSLGGQITGLTANGLSLTDGTETLPVAPNATSFTFNQPLAYTSYYSVGVAAQPTGLSCSVSNGTGYMPASNVSNVQVTCSPQAQAYSVGGSITGLTQGGLQLVNNSNGDQLTVSAGATSFMMGQKVASGSNYDVAVHTNPTGQTCTVTNGRGTMGAGNVTTVMVSCTLNSYSLGGSVNGVNLGGLLVSAPLKLANGPDEITVPFSVGQINFTFDKPVAYLSSYTVVVSQQPSVLGLTLTCTVKANGSGTMVVGGVSNVDVECL
jgi:hypothetical protein